MLEYELIGLELVDWDSRAWFDSEDPAEWIPGVELKPPNDGPPTDGPAPLAASKAAL